MSNYVRNISVGNPSDPNYDERPIKVDSDHVDMATYDPSTTESDSLTKKIHDLEEATPDPATASTAGIVKPGAGLQMHPGSTDGTLDLAYDHTLTLTNESGATIGTFNGSADATISVATVPTNHASVNTSYGVGDSSKYGHLKMVDTYKTAPAAPSGVSFSAKGANDMYVELSAGVGTELTQAQYDQLTPQEQENGDYYITDAPGPGIHASSIPLTDTKGIVGTAGSTTDVQTFSTALAGTEITQAQYDQLTPAQKVAGLYYITDSAGADVVASDVPATDTYNVLGGGAGAATDTQTLMDGMYSKLNQSIAHLDMVKFTPNSRYSIKDDVNDKWFTFPKSGYLFVNTKGTGNANVSLMDTYFSFTVPANSYGGLFVFKGMNVSISSSNITHVDHVYFIPVKD